MLKQFAIEIIPLTPMEDKLEKMNAYNELTNTNATIPIEAFDGRRRAYPGENEYVKGLMLTFFSKTVNIVFWIIMVSVTALSLYGAKSLFDVISYNLIRLQFSDIVVESVVLVLLVVAVICGIKVMWKELQNTRKSTEKEDLINGRFYVVEVEIVAYHHNSDMESSESLATIRDCNGNIAVETILTVNWQEMNKTKKGLVVIVGEEQKATVLNRVIPRYDENSRFCQKYRKAYLKKYGC